MAAAETMVVADQVPQPSPMALYVGGPRTGHRGVILFLSFDPHSLTRRINSGLSSSVDELASVRVYKNPITGHSLGYCYVNYISPDDATHAMEKLNHTLLNGKPIRVMWFVRHSDVRSSGIGNLFVKNLGNSIGNAKLYEMFSKFRSILSCKVATNAGGKRNSAIENLHGSSFDGKTIYVANFVKKHDSTSHGSGANFTSLYMKNLDQDITEEIIELKFSEFGKMLSVSIAKDDNGNSKGFGFVNYESSDCATRAMEAMHGGRLGMIEGKRHAFQTSNVYVKNIVDAVDDNALRERSSEFGNITSAKVLLDEKEGAKGLGLYAIALLSRKLSKLTIICVVI
ncbi:hypothetical protein C4D60_Mb08t19860 [Musa balbisiana]|uniref:RRM domain-containing protein n=1 Tax=Musa balbisiana TaxID=52838 RepID=A0A4S8K534_MUSBA|nr:hypothetical protein C4D60_Mb08t19860 [Musa balbisiana]